MRRMSDIVGVAAAALGLGGMRVGALIRDEFHRFYPRRRAWPSLVFALYERGSRLPTLPPAPPARLTKRQRRRQRGKLRSARA